MKIYHNPRCSKSRKTLSLIKEKNQKIEIIEYLKNNLTISELENIINKLNMQPIDLVRKNEKIWKENLKKKKRSQQEIIKLMIKNPKIIERPIVVNGDQAVIGRPPENVLKIIN